MLRSENAPRATLTAIALLASLLMIGGAIYLQWRSKQRLADVVATAARLNQQFAAHDADLERRSRGLVQASEQETVARRQAEQAKLEIEATLEAARRHVYAAHIRA